MPNTRLYSTKLSAEALTSKNTPNQAKKANEKTYMSAEFKSEATNAARGRSTGRSTDRAARRKASPLSSLREAKATWREFRFGRRHERLARPTGGRKPPSPPRLTDQVRDRIRRLGLSLRTEEAYCRWIRRFIVHHGKRHPREMGAPEVEAFLTELARRRGVAASTQNQALAALLFPYREVLRVDLPCLGNTQRVKRPVRVPTVLSRAEVGRVLAELPAPHWLICSLLYGAGLRLLECLKLRIQDVDFARNELTVRHGKGGKDRTTELPRALVEPLQDQVSMVRETHRRDRLAGFGRAVVSASLQRKPRTSLEDPGRQFVFPAKGRSRDQRTGLGRVVTGAHGRSLIGHA